MDCLDWRGLDAPAEVPAKRPIPGEEPWDSEPPEAPRSAFVAALRRFLYQDEEWKERARCRNEDTALFFPHRGQSQIRAKALCAKCPVRAECDDYANRSNSTYGIWGGAIRHRGPQIEDGE